MAKKKTSFKRLKLFGKISALLSMVLLVLIAGVFAVFSMSNGRLWLIHTGIEAANNESLQIQVENLKSPRISKLSLDKLTIHINNEKLLELNSFVFEWAPLALLSKKLDIRKVRANEVHVYKLTKASSKEDPPKNKEPGTVSIPFAIRLKDVGVNTVQLHSFELNGKEIPPVSVNASLNAFTEDQLVELSLKLDSLTEKPYHLTLNAKSDSPTSFQLQGELQEPERNWLSGILKLPKKETLDASFSLELDTTEPQWEIGIQNIQLPLFEHNIQLKGTALVDLKNQNYQAEEIIVTTDDKEHRLRGGYGAENLWFDIKFNKFPLTIAKPWVDEIESGHVSGKFQGDWLHTNKDTWPQITADASVNVRAKEQTASANFVGKLNNKLITLSQSEISVEQSQFKIRGAIDPFGDRSNINFSVSQFNSEILTPWPVELPKELSFFIQDAEGKIQNQLTSPDYSLRINADVQFQGNPIQAHANLKGNLDQADIQILKVTALDSLVELNGLVDWRKAGNQFEVKIQNLNEQVLTFVPEEALKNIPNALTFNSSFNASVLGKLLEPKVVTAGSVKGQYPIETDTLPYQLDFDLEAQVAPISELSFDISNFELSLFDKSAINLSGRYSRESFDIKTQINRLPTQTLALFGVTQLKGTAAANINISGNIESPRIAGDFKYSHKLNNNTGEIIPVGLNGKIETIEDDFKLAIRFSENEKNAGNLSLDLPLSLYLNSFLDKRPLNSDLPIQARLKADLNLATINTLLNSDLHQFSGHIDTELNLEGTLNQSSASGFAKLKQGSYSHLALGTHLNDIEINLVSENDMLTIDHGKIKTPENGSISMKGFLDWKGFLERSTDKLVDISITAKEAVVFEKQDINAKIGGKFNLTGGMEALLLEGKIHPTPLNISIDSALKTSIPEIKVTEVRETTPGKTTNSYLPPIQLKIDVNVDQQAFIRGRGLETEVAGNVQVRGTADSPEITGEFRTRRGKLDAFGKTFVLQNGQVRISNEIIGLNIPAVYTGKDHEYRIEIFGTSDQPKLRVSAIPSLPEDEILSRLIFGKSVQEITPFQALRLAQAVRTLSTGGGFDPLDSARHMLGVDSIKIDSENTDDGQQVSVGIGKYISEGVYLEVERSNNPAQPWEGSIQIELTPRVRLKGGTGETGAGEAEILWKKDY